MRFNPSRVLLLTLTSAALLGIAPAWASPSIQVISPRMTSTGSPVFFEANATTSCQNGIASMRIYTAPGVNAYTTPSAHLETFLTLAPGTYNAAVQAWDNCGGVSKAAVSFTVTSQAQVTLFLPSAPSASGPIHFAASAQNSACAAGIAAMRLYTSWGWGPYTVSGNELNAFVQLGQAPVYSATMQAWDNCGNVLKTNFDISGSGDTDSYLYTVDQNGKLAVFKVSEGLTPAAMTFSSGPSAQSMVKHPSGWFLYVSTLSGIYGYWINPTNGALVDVAGSPFFGNLPPGTLFADPAGNFLYAIQPVPSTGKEPSTIIDSYKIDRSSGALSASSSTTVPQLIVTISTDFYGQFLYATGGGITTDPSHIYGFSVDPNTGALAPVYGSPFEMADTQYAFALSAAYQYLFVGTLTNNGDIRSYQINYNSGSLYPPLGPYSATNALDLPQGMLSDWLARYVWTVNNPASDGQYSFSLFHLDGYTGGLTGPYPTSTGTLPIEIMTESNEANAVYAAGGACGPVSCTPGRVSAWSLAADGTPQLLNSVPMGSSNPAGIVVGRTHQE